MIVPVSAKPTKMYKVHNKVYLGFSAWEQGIFLCSCYNQIPRNGINVFQQQICSHTRYEIAEAYGGHSYETEIEPIKEIPVVLPQHEHAGTASKVQKE